MSNPSRRFMWLGLLALWGFWTGHNILTIPFWVCIGYNWRLHENWQGRP